MRTGAATASLYIRSACVVILACKSCKNSSSPADKFSCYSPKSSFVFCFVGGECPGAASRPCGLCGAKTQESACPGSSSHVLHCMRVVHRAASCFGVEFYVIVLSHSQCCLGALPSSKGRRARYGRDRAELSDDGWEQLRH